MTSTYTTNKSIEKPGNGDYVNTWNVPVNSDWDIIDTSFGGTTTVNATGASGTVTLTASQYRPPTIIITGTLTANVTYSLPSGIGGHWVIYNNTSGAYTVTFASAGGGTSTSIPQGYRVLVYCDGTNTALGVTAVSVGAAGSSGQVQYNNGGALAGSSNFTFDGTNLVLGATSAGEMRIRNVLQIYGTTSGYVGLTVPSAAGGTTYTLPNADGTSGQVLSTDGAGTLSWATASGGGGGSGVSSFSGGSTGLTPSSPATGDVVLGGTLEIASGGTGAANAATARSNILPSYTGNASKVLTVNSGATDVEWTTPTASTGNITFSANTISASNTNGNIILSPPGSGEILMNTSSSVFSGQGILEVVANASGSRVYPGIFKSQSEPRSCIMWNSTTTGDCGFWAFGTETTYTFRGSITYNRASGVVAFNTSSDYRAKDVYGPVTDSGEKVDSIKIYRGKMHEATIERPMAIAHELAEPAPYAVTGKKDAVDEKGKPIYQQVDYTTLVPLLIVEIQSLRARVAALEAK